MYQERMSTQHIGNTNWLSALWIIGRHTTSGLKMADLAVPFKVSPFIRFSRWSLLLLGVGYGAIRNRSLSKKEAAIREIEVKQKAIRDAKLAEEKARLSKLELDDLAKMAGVPPEP